jgi:hypothetical protein
VFATTTHKEKNKMQSLRNCIAITALVAGVGLNTAVSAGGYTGGAALPPVDSLLTTMFDKSVIAGSIAKGADGTLAFDPAGNLMFNYSGKVYSVDTSARNGKLTGLEKQDGTVEGQAAFPMSFAQMAMGMKAYLDGVGPLPSDLPPVIDWTCNHCNLVIGDSTYQSIVDVAMFSPAATEAMRMKGRAFTGLGPVEVGQLSAQSMSVRMAGCSAVVGVAGPDAGKVGTLCLNGTFTFDLSGINLANPMTSNLVGTGTSNCIIVMHKPLAL